MNSIAFLKENRKKEDFVKRIMLNNKIYFFLKTFKKIYLFYSLEKEKMFFLT